MVRPAKSESDKRTFRLNLRLTAEERIDLELAAAKAGLSVSAYVRAQALAGRVVVGAGRRLAPETFIQIVRIGTNLNQIAKRINAGEKSLPPEFGRLCATIESILAAEVTGDGTQSRR